MERTPIANLKIKKDKIETAFLGSASCSISLPPSFVDAHLLNLGLIDRGVPRREAYLLGGVARPFQNEKSPFGKPMSPIDPLRK